MKNTGYIANNLNGRATATFVKKVGRNWITTDGQIVSGKVYDDPEKAKAAARRKWTCK